MSKKTGLFCFIKKLFLHDAHKQQQLECKRRRWLFPRLKKTVKGLPSSEEEAVEHKPVIVTQVGRMSDQEVRESIIECVSDAPICTVVETDEEKVCSLNALSHAEHQATTKIQTSYRGYLARKASKALRGFVTLQAIIRGRAVRRQAATTLKCLQSLVSIQSEICARRRQMSREMCRSDLSSLDVRPEKPKTMETQLSSERRSDCRLPTKDDEVDIILRKKEAIVILQKIEACSFSRRKSRDSEDGSTEGRRKYMRNQYVDDKLCPKYDQNGGNHPINGPRRSLQNQRKNAKDGLHRNCPTNLPTYMAATKSAKAKTRSMTSPRLRAMHFESFSDGDYSPYKQKYSPMTSINSEVTSSGFSKGSYNKSCYCSSQQNSLSLKGGVRSGPVRSSRIMDDIGL